MKCPYCDSEVQNNVMVCPHCMGELRNNVRVVQINTGGASISVNNTQEENHVEQKKKYTKYFIIIAILAVVLVSLNIMIALKMKPEKKIENKPNDENTTSVILKDMTLNTGVFSGKENPVSFGNMTIASIYDESKKVTKLVDVMVTRYLSGEEVSEITSSHNMTLNPGFTFVGIEYNVYFHDLGYLGNQTLSPVLKANILDSKFFNDFFLVDDHYYKSDAITVYNGPNIKNGESATLRLVYQVPINQNYYICFGSEMSNLGCFNG